MADIPRRAGTPQLAGIGLCGLLLAMDRGGIVDLGYFGLGLAIIIIVLVISLMAGWSNTKGSD